MSLVTINIHVCVDMLDKADAKKVNINEHRRVRTRPHVSVVNPQKFDDNKIPIKITEFIRPCSLGDMFRSHLAIGSASDILEFSNAPLIAAIPETNSITYWNFPIPIIYTKIELC